MCRACNATGAQVHGPLVFEKQATEKPLRSVFTHFTLPPLPTNIAQLDDNMKQLEEEITRSCNQVIRAIERRREELQHVAQNIYADKLKYLQSKHDSENTHDGNDFSIGGCLRFVTDNALTKLIENYGVIDEKRAAAANCKVSGIGLQFGIANEPIEFQLETYNHKGEMSWVEQDKVEVEIKGKEETFPCIIKNKCTGAYDVCYELPEAGQYKIHVKINGKHINKLPFECRVFHKTKVRFLDADDKTGWTFQSGVESVLHEKTSHQSTSRLYSPDQPSTKAWKVRVTTACNKLKLKFGYANNLFNIPDLIEEFCCQFDLSEIISQQKLTHYHHHERRHSRHPHHERKRSSFERSSLNFYVFQDEQSNSIHTAVEGMSHTKQTKFPTDSKTLVPFIGIKHYCKNSNCPRPMIAFN